MHGVTCYSVLAESSVTLLPCGRSALLLDETPQKHGKRIRRILNGDCTDRPMWVWGFLVQAAGFFDQLPR